MLRRSFIYTKVDTLNSSTCPKTQVDIPHMSLGYVLLLDDKPLVGYTTLSHIATNNC